MKKTMFIILLAITLIFSGCPEPDPQDTGTENNGGETVIYTMTLQENEGWSTHDDWGRWFYDYQDANNLFDLSGMLANGKVYILNYSFSSDTNIDSLGFYFIDTSDWKMLSNYTPMVGGSINKNTKYSGKIAIIPNDDAAGCLPSDIFFRIDIRNRNVNTPATLSFYQFEFEKVNKEVSTTDRWTISDKEFTIPTGKTYAEILSSFNSKSNVLHVKPAYNSDSYGDFVIEYDLNGYRGKTIEIEMSMDVYLTKSAWVAWQINSSNPFYPVVCGRVKTDDRFPDHSGPAFSENTWHQLTGSYIYTVPDTGSNDYSSKTLYLSGQQLEGAEAYFANATVAIKEVPPKITFIESTEWNKPGNDGYNRWYYDYQDANKSFDLSGMLTNKKVYVFKYSFTSDINIDKLAAWFCNTDSDWKNISEWTLIKTDISNGTKYSGTIAIIPQNNAAGCNPDNTRLSFMLYNRNVSTPATLTFDQFEFEQVNFAFTSNETNNWNLPGNENNDRWYFNYQDSNNLFDLSGMLSGNKKYTFTYSFTSNINIDKLDVYFFNTDSGWELISDKAAIKDNIIQNTKYSGTVSIIPNSDAASRTPANTYLSFGIKNRNVSTPATLIFDQFKLEQVNK